MEERCGFLLLSTGGLPTVSMALPGYDSSIGGSRTSSQRYSPEFKDEAVQNGQKSPDSHGMCNS